jgi:hypothetical protein
VVRELTVIPRTASGCRAKHRAWRPCLGARRRADHDARGLSMPVT